MKWVQIYSVFLRYIFLGYCTNFLRYQFVFETNLFPHTAVILDVSMVSQAGFPLRRQLSLWRGVGPVDTLFSISSTTELAVPGAPAIYQ